MHYHGESDVLNWLVDINKAAASVRLSIICWVLALDLCMYFAETDTVSIVHVWKQLWNLRNTPSIALHRKIYNSATGLEYEQEEEMDATLIFCDENLPTSPTRNSALHYDRSSYS